MNKNHKTSTKITGLIGWPVEHTLSPIMHNAGFKKLGLNFCYLPLAVKPQDLAKAVRSLKAREIAGVNITIPHKETVIKFLNEIRGAARTIGAVNTVINEAGRLIGYNTDGPGFIEFLKKDAGFSPKNKIITLIGAGGAGRALAFMLLNSGAGKIYLYDALFQKSQNLKKALAAKFARQKVTVIKKLAKKVWQEILSQTDLLINATPVGLAPKINACPLPAEYFDFLKKTSLVVDLIYNPGKTIFLKEAAQRKLRNFNGLGLLVWQGILAFELFTGSKIKPQIFRTALKKSGKSN